MAIPTGTSKSVVTDFKDSKNWFKNSVGALACVTNVTRHGEYTSSDKSGVKISVSEFKDFADAEDFISQQVFSCDETDLFWEKIRKCSLHKRKGQCQ